MKTSKEADMLCFSDLSSHNFNTLIKEDKNYHGEPIFMVGGDY